MERIDRFGRLLQLIIPGEEEKFPYQPKAPCSGGCKTEYLEEYFRKYFKQCVTYDNKCCHYIYYINEVIETDKDMRYIYYDFMKKAIKKYHIKHYMREEHAMYIPSNDDVKTVLYLFDDGYRWRDKTNVLVPLLYKKSSTTFEAIKVTLKMSGTRTEWFPE